MPLARRRSPDPRVGIGKVGGSGQPVLFGLDERDRDRGRGLRLRRRERQHAVGPGSGCVVSRRHRRAHRHVRRSLCGEFCPRSVVLRRRRWIPLCPLRSCPTKPSTTRSRPRRHAGLQPTGPAQRHQSTSERRTPPCVAAVPPRHEDRLDGGRIDSARVQEGRP
jgi:hypothetical protein